MNESFADELQRKCGGPMEGTPCESCAKMQCECEARMTEAERRVVEAAEARADVVEKLWRDGVNVSLLELAHADEAVVTAVRALRAAREGR